MNTHAHRSHNHMITIAVPTGRLKERVFEHFHECGITIPFPKRQLIIHDSTNSLRVLLVKNTDLPEYVHGGIASIGIVGSDVIGESAHSFFQLGTFPWGNTNICLIGKEGVPPIHMAPRTTIATKFTKFTRTFIQKRDIIANIIKLNGSVEIAPLLGLAPYIIDLVETGQTVKENGLKILETIDTTKVCLITNKSLYKLNYKEINKVVRLLKL